MLSLKTQVDQWLAKEGSVNALLVFPTRRAIRIFKNETEINPLPLCTSLDDMLQGLTGTIVPPVQDLKLLLSSAIQELKLDEIQGQKAYALAKELLTEFNELDLALADPKKTLHLFAEYKKLDFWTPEKVAASSFNSHLAFWKKLFELYELFDLKLHDKQWSYQGRLFKWVIEQPLYLSSQNIEEWAGRDLNKIGFVGFNAFSPAESKLIQKLKRLRKVAFFWEADTYYLSDNKHEAGRFIRENLSIYGNEGLKESNDLLQEKKQLDVMSCSGTHTMLRKAVSEFVESKGSAVLVVGDETHFPLLLNELAHYRAFEKVNCSLRMGLGDTPVGKCLLQLMKLTDDMKHKGYLEVSSIKSLLSLLSETITTASLSDLSEWCDHRMEHHRFRIYMSHLEKEVDFPLLVALTHKSYHKVWEAFLHWTSSVQKGESVFSNVLIKVQKILADIDAHSLENSLYLTDIIRSTKIDVVTSDAPDHMITGLLETRLLSYKNVIFTSMEEGIIPAKSAKQGLIPIQIRNALGMQTIQDKDAIFSYHFYRLIQNGKRITLFYNSNKALEGGEPSRYIPQLKTELLPKNPAIVFNETLVTVPVVNPPAIEHSVQYTDTVRKQLIERVTKRGISASAIMKFKQDPFDFYLRYVIGVKEEVAWDGHIADNDFGSILHNVLEQAYKTIELPYTMNKGALQVVSKAAFELLDKEYVSYFGESQLKEGSIRLSRYVAKDILERFFKWEATEIKKHAQYRILDIERFVNKKVDIGGVEVKFTGFIDRVDEVDGQVRIIDYKSGNVDPKDLRVSNIIDLFESDKYGKAVQLAMYDYLYDYRGKNAAMVGNISLRQYNPAVIPLKQIEDMRDDFQERLHQWTADLITQPQEFCKAPLEDNKVSFGLID